VAHRAISLLRSNYVALGADCVKTTLNDMILL